MYSAEEKETTCIYDFIDDCWNVYSCVPRHITKLLKVAGEPYWTEKGKGGRLTAAKWRVQGNQVRFFSPATIGATEAQRAASIANLKRAQGGVR